MEFSIATLLSFFVEDKLVAGKVLEKKLGCEDDSSLETLQIILDVLPSLVENGIIFYSTCSYSVKENEDIVAWMIKDHQMEYVQISIQKEWGIIDTGLGYRFYPHLTKSEGFFCAVLRKKTEKRSSSHFKKKSNVEASKQNIQLLGPFLNQLNNQSWPYLWHDERAHGSRRYAGICV